MKIRISKYVNATISNKRISAEGQITFVKNKHEIYIEGPEGENNNNVINNVVTNNIVMVNGRIIASSSSSSPKPKSKKKYIKIDEPIGKIDDIHLSNSSTLNINNDNIFKDFITVNISGCSSLSINKTEIDTLIAEVSGCSSLSGSYTVRDMDAKVSGCSSCSGAHITESGDLNASGISKIRATCNSLDSVKISECGMSKVVVNCQRQNTLAIEHRKPIPVVPAIMKKPVISDEKKREMRENAKLYELD